MDYSHAVFGACLFVFSIATSFRIQQKSNNKNTLRVKISPLKDQLKIEQYDNVLIEVQLPFSGSNKMVQKLKNDEIISKIVPMVRNGFYLYICAEINLPKSIVCEYISDTYSRIWDEMLKNNKLSLNCVVVGDIYGSDLISRKELRNLPELNAIFTFDSENKLNMEMSRSDLKLKEISYINTDQLVCDKAINNKINGENTVNYYFDDDIIHIPKFRVIALGGTFDCLHNGHKKLLTLAAAVTTELLIVGITGDDMLKNKSNCNSIKSFNERKQNVISFLLITKPKLKVEIVELSDPYGPTITDSTIEALVVSSETMSVTNKINQIRIEVGFHPLVTLISRRSDAATMSSTFIRDKSKN